MAAEVPREPSDLPLEANPLPKLPDFGHRQAIKPLQRLLDLGSSTRQHARSRARTRGTEVTHGEEQGEPQMIANAARIGLLLCVIPSFACAGLLAEGVPGNIEGQPDLNGWFNWSIQQADGALTFSHDSATIYGDKAELKTFLEFTIGFSSNPTTPVGQTCRYTVVTDANRSKLGDQPALWNWQICPTVPSDVIHLRLRQPLMIVSGTYGERSSPLEATLEVILRPAGANHQPVNPIERRYAFHYIGRSTREAYYSVDVSMRPSQVDCTDSALDEQTLKIIETPCGDFKNLGVSSLDVNAIASHLKDSNEKIGFQAVRVLSAFPIEAVEHCFLSALDNRNDGVKAAMEEYLQEHWGILSPEGKEQFVAYKDAKRAAEETQARITAAQNAERARELRPRLVQAAHFFQGKKQIAEQLRFQLSYQSTSSQIQSRAAKLESFLETELAPAGEKFGQLLYEYADLAGGQAAVDLAIEQGFADLLH
jgi:hypothetical protein